MIDTEVHEARRSEYFNMLAWMSLLGTEDGQIRATRSHDAELYEDLDLTYEDIERVGYLYPHFHCNPKYDGFTELWIEDHYINPKVVTWIKTTNVLYGVLDAPYKEQVENNVNVKCFYNPSIIFRYSNVGTPGDLYSHDEIIDISDDKFTGITDITKSVYFISENKFHIPKVTLIEGTRYKISADYTTDIDLFICLNLVNVLEVKANEGTPVINVTSNRCYHRMFVDHSPDYPIDCRFYPYIKIDKNCIVRVFNDISHRVVNPTLSRIINYDEFAEDIIVGDRIDPYNSTSEYLNSLEPVDDIINADDSDEIVLQKFEKISAYCYRMWEEYPWNPNEQSDFVVCDNTVFGKPCFIVKEIKTTDETLTKICSTVPFESYRDLLFYKGQLFSDYTIMNILYKQYKSYAAWIETVEGMPVYIIDSQYDPNEFTLIKFNAFEDSTYVNIDQYFNKDFINRLHFKMNRFYRNLLVIRKEYEDTMLEKVRVSTIEPSIHDQYLWYELLVNAVPEMFEKKTIDIINLYGLDPDKIPEDIIEGAYMLELDPKDGPVSYSKLLMTYFNLSKAKRDYLALQYDNPQDDPRIAHYDHLNLGIENDFGNENEINHLLIRDTFVSSSEDRYEYGRPNDPGIGDYHTPGNLYGQLELSDPPFGEENVDIDKIETGPQTPIHDPDHTLWIDTGDEPFDQVWRPNELDGETTYATFTNDTSTINPEISDYAIEIDSQQQQIANDDVTFSELLDGVRPSASPIPSGNSDIDGLLDNLDGPDEVPLESTDLIDQIGNTIANNVQVDTIEDPTLGMIALDDIGYMHADTFEPLTIDEIAEMSQDEKLNTLRKLITDDNDPENARIGDLWIQYLSTQSSETINTIVYKVLLTVRAQQLTHVTLGDLALEGVNFPEDWETLAYGSYPNWTKPKQMLITPFGEDNEGNLRPDYDIIKANLLNYFYMNMPDMNDSTHGPDDAIEGDLWLNIDNAYLGQIIKDLISSTLLEFGIELPEGVYFEDDHDIYASMGLDYAQHDNDNVDTGEIWKKIRDDKLYPITYKQDEPNPITMDEGDLWYEFIDDINNRVAYSDSNSMVIRVDERLLLLKFDHGNIQTFAFDDIIMNFKGKLGLRYMTLLSDLINSGEIKIDDINIFWKRLITYGDEFDPRMHRLYTGKSFVISTPKIDTSDYSVIYSTNIGRFRMNYADDSTTRKEREAAYRMCIDYTTRENFAFLENRMLVFINGKYIPRTQLKEVAAYMLYVENFDEVISTVDIFYMKKDQLLMEMKRTAYKYWPQPDISTYIQRPEENYNKMEKIHMYDYTYRGYYDVLLNEFIFSGKLEAMLKYIENNPELADEYKKDLIRKFHAISDTDLANISENESRIIIPTFGSSEDTPYQIGYREPRPDYHIWDGNN